MGSARAAAITAAAAGALTATLSGLAIVDAMSPDAADAGPTVVRSVAAPGAQHGPFAVGGAAAPAPAPEPRAAPAVGAAPVTGSFAASGVPARVLQAYRTAAAAAAPACGLEWSLLAAVGHVESGHARGGRLDAAGRTVSPIVGPALDGGPGVRAIADSDGGRLDGDPVWDRAVGPMQFIPGTWAVSGADGDRDGRADPHQVDDAALAAARYLCAGGGDLSTTLGALAALLRYNASDAYARRVLSLAGSYRDGVPVRAGFPLPGPVAPIAGAPVPAPVPVPPPLLAPGAVVVPPPAEVPAPLPGAVPPVPPATTGGLAPSPTTGTTPPTTTAPATTPPITTAPATTTPATPPATAAPATTAPATTAPTTTAPTTAPATPPLSGTGSTTSTPTGTATTGTSPDTGTSGATPPAQCPADGGTPPGCTTPAP